MENEMYGIGETARESGLGVSALRFYDRAGVLVPARVDPVTGYRWYAPEQVAEAALLARLRRTGMPLADVRLVLAGRSAADTALVRTLLDAHLRRLEQGLADARVEFSAIRALLATRENTMSTPTPTSAPAPAARRSPSVRVTVAGPALAAALDSVRFAVGVDPEVPMLHGVLFDVEDGALRVVATDRYRLAVGHAPAEGHDGPRAQTLVPAPLVDAMRALLTGGAPATLRVADGLVALETDGRATSGPALDQDFPDYRRLTRLPAGRSTRVNARAFADAVRADPAPDALIRLTPAPNAELRLTADGEETPDTVAVKRAYLLDALTAGSEAAGVEGAGAELILELGAPDAPVAVRRTDTEDSFSLLMPVRVEH
ncbi:MerR family transcriptional regulator [Streptomyces sp. BI20]|uniref:DNA polymerase III subunit beta family protein n=1 Tax=Streptomyces sp. BI20 TaxID=3403460 RepID=UPI003C773D98